MSKKKITPDAKKSKNFKTNNVSYAYTYISINFIFDIAFSFSSSFICFFSIILSSVLPSKIKLKKLCKPFKYEKLIKGIFSVKMYKQKTFFLYSYFFFQTENTAQTFKRRNQLPMSEKKITPDAKKSKNSKSKNVSNSN